MADTASFAEPVRSLSAVAKDLEDAGADLTAAISTSKTAKDAVNVTTAAVIALEAEYASARVIFERAIAAIKATL